MFDPQFPNTSADAYYIKIEKSRKTAFFGIFVHTKTKNVIPRNSRSYFGPNGDQVYTQERRYKKWR